MHLQVAFKNRHNRPWIIVLQHRPFYCSSDTNEDCSHKRSILKTCYINNNEYGLEDLYYRNGVDIIFAGHMHYYERSWPLYNNEVYNGSSGPYTNPGATVHIITGAAVRIPFSVLCHKGSTGVPVFNYLIPGNGEWNGNGFQY